MSKIVVIPIIVSLLSSPQDKNQIKEESIPIYKANVEKNLEMENYNKNEITIPIRSKIKNSKRIKSNYFVKVSESKNFININISISKVLLKSKKVLKLPPKKVDISVEE